MQEELRKMAQDELDKWVYEHDRKLLGMVEDEEILIPLKKLKINWNIKNGF